MIKIFACLGLILLLALALAAQPPSVASGGVTNAASFAKDASGNGAAVAPGSLVSIFGSFPGALMADADTVPFSTSLGGASVTFNGIPAPIRDVSPTGAFPFINAQMPFNVLNGLNGASTVPVIVTVNGSSAPQQVPVVPVAPGIFTIPPGVGVAVVVNLTDLSVAAPTNANLGVPSRPIKRGEQAFMYVTGLGAMTPPIQDGFSDNTTTHVANSTPIVWIGGVNSGVTAQVLFAGQAPPYPGVNQINLMIPQNAPTGDAVQIQVQSADGSVVSPPNVATIAIQ